MSDRNFNRKVTYLIGDKKPDLILVGEKIVTSKFYTSQVSQKALFIHLKFYFKTEN